MAELYAIMSRRTITATLTGLSETHNNGRTFHWYLDGELVKTEQIKDQLSSLDHTYTAVPYRAEHTVSVQINDYDDEDEFGLYSASVADTMSLWSWSASNGLATAAQTQAAYIAAATQGQTADFSRLVWNDLVELLVSTVMTWKDGYASIDDTLMAAKYDSLTADRFNAAVQNIGNPWMYWVCKPGRKGYIGRLAVKGYKQYGANADTVYGDYLIELAHMLNVLIDAEGEFNAGYAKRMAHTNASGLYTSASLPLRAPPSRHLDLYEALHWEASQRLTAPPSLHLERTGKLWTVPNLTFRADEAKHLAIRNRIRIFPDMTLIATNERDMYADLLIGVLTDVLLTPALSGILSITESSGTIPDVTLTPIASSPLGVTIRFGPGADVTLSPTPSEPLGVVIHLNPVPDITLTPSDSTLFNATVAEVSAILAELNPSASGILGITAGHTTVPEILLSNPAAAWMAHSGTASIVEDVTLTAKLASSMKIGDAVKFYWEWLDMTAPLSARMEYTSDDTLAAVLDAVLRNPAAAKLNHDVTMAFASYCSLPLRNPASARMEYASLENFNAVLDAIMRNPTAARMVHEVQSAVSAILSADLSDAESRDLATSGSCLVSQTFDGELAAPDSVPFAADIADSLNDAADMDLSATPSAVLEGGDSGNKTESDSTMDSVSSAPLSGDCTVHSAGDYSLSYGERVSIVVVDFRSVSRFAAALELEGEAIVEWVTQDGTNLYIRGAWSSWNDGENLQIDTLEFYAPVRDGSDLHIRSAWFSYQDRTNANIDTDFFLDPIQTGSNLYIRQDVLGG